MKKLALLFIIGMPFWGFSQEEFPSIRDSSSINFQNDSGIETIFGRGGDYFFAGYGAPILKVTYFAGSFGAQIGGKGGVIINRTIAFGGVGYALSNSFLFGRDNSTDVLFGGGGIFGEYIFEQESWIHVSIPLNLCFGRFFKSRSGIILERSRAFIIEPGVNLEFNLFDFFIPALSLSYRQTIGSNLEGYDNLDLSGVSFGFVLKFGKF